ncbi:ATP F0F1 synthase subunit B [Devosia sp.]|jgi:F-type H+-transporting ATPase subunit b|uniref:F0F1 ATP synthase subunit B family protein n=1 Tax=Devosia sp. TaxID=1871048 RepID=UPI0037BECF1F
MAGSTQQTNEAPAANADVLQQGEVLTPAEGHATDATGAAAAAHGTETHAGTEAHSAFPPFDPTYFGGQLLWLALTFGALYLIMSRVALPRIGSILESRRVRIEGDLKEAERLRQETERAAQAYEQALADARTNAHKIAEETRASIKADIDGKRADVEADLGKRVADAEARILATKQAALGNVDGIAAEAAAALVEKLSNKVTAAQAKSAVATAVKEMAS